MRVSSSFAALSMIAALASAACGGSTPPAVAAAESPTPEAAAQPNATPEPSKPTAADDEGWSGEKTEKSADSAPASAEPMPASGDSKAPETRTMDVIRKLIVDNRQAARKCYDDARKTDRDLTGDVVIHFVLNPEGKVKTAELNQERSTLKTPAVVNCVIGVIKGIAFPRSSRAMETSTNYPFNFTP